MSRQLVGISPWMDNRLARQELYQRLKGKTMLQEAFQTKYAVKIVNTMAGGTLSEGLFISSDILNTWEYQHWRLWEGDISEFSHEQHHLHLQWREFWSMVTLILGMHMPTKKDMPCVSIPLAFEKGRQLLLWFHHIRWIQYMFHLPT